MAMGGRSIPVPGGGVGNPGYQRYDEEYQRYVDELRRQNGAAGGAGSAQRVLQELFGAQNAGSVSRDGGRPGMMSGPGTGGAFGGSPFSSEMGGLNNSYRTRGSAPRYHEEIPMGGSRGVFALRNDEIMGGPQRDAWWLNGDWKSRTGAIGNRFGRR